MPQHWPQVLPLVRCSNGTRGCSELSQNRNPAMCPDESCANRWIVYLPWPTSVSLCMCLCLCVGIFALLHTRTGAHISTRAGRFRPLPHTLSTLLGQIHPFGATDRSTHTNTHTHSEQARFGARDTSYRNPSFTSPAPPRNPIGLSTQRDRLYGQSACVGEPVNRSESPSKPDETNRPDVGKSLK